MTLWRDREWWEDRRVIAVLCLREQGLSLYEVGREMGLTPERVRQLDLEPRKWFLRQRREMRKGRDSGERNTPVGFYKRERFG